MVTTALNGTTDPKLSGTPIDLIATGAVPLFIWLGQSGQLGGDYQWGNDGPGSYDATVYSERGEVNLTEWDISYNYGVFQYENGAIFDEFRARQEDVGGGFKANPSLYMARYLKSTLWKNRPIYSCFYAVGGTPISKFKNRGVFNAAMLGRVKEAVNSLLDAGYNVIPILCWNQGETQDIEIYGDLATSISNFATDLTYMINELRHFLSVSINNGNTVPIMVYKVPYDQTGPMVSPAHNADINTQIVSAVAALDNAHIVDYSGKNVFDNTHVTAQGQIEALSEFDTAFRGITTWNIITGKVAAVPAIAAHYDGATGVTSAGGSVSSWADQTANKFDVVQATAGNQPTISGTTITFDGSNDALIGTSLTYSLGVRELATTKLPDAGSGVTGEGFTCTGITYAPDTDTYWIADNGIGLATDTVRAPHLIELSNDFSTVLTEINLTSITSDGRVQGVTYDTSDNTLWFADVGSSGKIYHVTKTGTLIESITMTAPSSGISYNPTNDSIYQSDQTTGNLYEWSCSTLTNLGTIALPRSGQDHIFYDDTNNILWYTLGANGSAGSIFGYNMTTLVEIPQLETSAADAIEGLYINTTTNRMYVCSDGFFHVTPTGENRVVTYDFGPSSGVEIWSVMRLTGSPTTTDCYVGLNNPIDSSPTNTGMAIYAPNSNSIVRAIFNGDEDTHLAPSANITSGTALDVAKASVRVKVDLYNCIVTLYFNGVSQGTDTLTNSGLRTINLTSISLGATVVPDREVPLELDCVMIMQELVNDTDASLLESHFVTKYSI